MNLTLRPYQHDIISDIRSAYRHGARAPLLQSPTGSGKSVIYAFITEGAARRNNRVLILEHRKELIKQTSDALFDIGVIHGIIAPGHTMTSDMVQVASVQTLIRRLDRIYPPDLIIVDEAQHAAAGSWSKIITTYPNAKLLGVTATPMRLDGRGLGIQSGGFFDTLINGPTVTDLVMQGFLSPSVVYAPKTDLDLTGLRKRFGDFINTEERVDKPTITGSAVEHYMKICPNVPAIAFCASVKHAEHVAAQFNQAGITAQSIDGTLSDYDRKSRIQGLTNGSIKILCSCDLISEGTDIPVVTAAILLRPTASLGLCKQQEGRVLRVFPGKIRAVILDHVGNTLKHGFPDDDVEWSLDGYNNGKRKTESERNPYIQCESCYRMFNRFLDRCPECGWKPTPQAREIEQVEGELKQIDEAERERIRIHLRREVGKARTKEDLEALAKARGYKSGWVYNILRARENRDVVYNR